jgi:FixJ family two-component response regulator
MSLTAENPRVSISPTSNSAHQVVCLVDDDASVRRSIGRLLESDGFAVHTFSNPKDFLAHTATHTVRVAVLDIWMDQISGMELLAHLCARSPHTQTIFITGHEDAAARATVMNAGAFAFFIKPFDDTEFLIAVRRAFSQHAGEEGEA